MNRFHCPSIETIIRNNPPGFFDGRSEDYIRFWFMQSMCTLQVKEIQNRESLIESWKFLATKRQEELDKAHKQIEELAKEARRTWWQRLWGKK